MAEKNKGGRPPFQPTDEQRKYVEAMSSVGIPQDDIARVVGVSAVTLRAHFREELDSADVKANAKVAGNLFRQATKDDPRSIPAAIFWAKTRLGWKESAQTHELVGANGGPVQTVALTEDRFKAIAKEIVDDV